MRMLDGLASDRRDADMMVSKGQAVIGYVRVSTAEQADAGNGLEAQEAAIRDECDRRGWVLAGIECDAGVSGRDLQRPGLSAALERVAAREVDGLIVAKLDRLSRSVIDSGMLFEWFAKAEAALIALDLRIDTSTPTGEMMANVVASVAKWEAATIAQRTRDGLAAKRAKGEPISRASLADRPELRERIQALRNAGRSMQGVANVLNAEGVPTLRGGKEWRPSSVQSVLGPKRRKPSRRTATLPDPRRNRPAA